MNILISIATTQPAFKFCIKLTIKISERGH